MSPRGPPRVFLVALRHSLPHLRQSLSQGVETNTGPPGTQARTRRGPTLTTQLFGRDGGSLVRDLTAAGTESLRVVSTPAGAVVQRQETQELLHQSLVAILRQ